MASVTPRRKRDGSVLTATVARVGNPKRVISPEDEVAIRDAMRAVEAAKDGVRVAVLTAAQHGASVRVLAEFTGKSTSTISGWKRDARSPGQ